MDEEVRDSSWKATRDLINAVTLATDLIVVGELLCHQPGFCYVLQVD